MSKVYLVKRTNEVDYDEYGGFVVIAKDSAGAIKICQEYSADEGPKAWKTANVTVIAEKCSDNQPRIVLGSFNAG